MSVSLMSVPVYAANLSRNNETLSGLPGWKVKGENIKIELNPLLRDQVRAFYLGRGFSEAISERISESCVYQTVIENTSDPNRNTQLEVDLSLWRVRSEKLGQPLINKSSWMRKWKQAGASEASVNAFRWATFPTTQVFNLTGDYGWGMILFGRKPGEHFDLELRWFIDGTPVDQKIENLICPD
jgi:hypothetical protein